MDDNICKENYEKTYLINKLILINSIKFHFFKHEFHH